jgi:hypothetical protein
MDAREFVRNARDLAPSPSRADATRTPMQTPHEDPAHPKHDVNNACLMYWANNSSAGLANLLTGGTVPDYDANCRADLAALKN